MAEVKQYTGVSGDLKSTSIDFGVTLAFELHLPVADLQTSIKFYRDILGLELARTSEERDYAFFWIGAPGSQMLGLWGSKCSNPPVSPGPSHFAMRVLGDDVEGSFLRLQQAGITPLDFYGNPSAEPEVICWMPAKAVYFKDPDGHSLEFIAMLPDEPRPELGVVVKLSDWKKRDNNII